VAAGARMNDRPTTSSSLALQTPADPLGVGAGAASSAGGTGEISSTQTVMLKPAAGSGGEPRLETLAIGSWVGPYRVEARLGEGGMGAVYRARSVIPVREVALKVIRAGATSERMLRRFELEAEVLRRLDHPGIARVFAAGTYDRGQGPQPYFAMELIQGEMLTAYASRRQLTVGERLALVARVADAVQHAHTKGVVHRDLKPSNILVVDEPEPATDGQSPSGEWSSLSGRPKVLDFGVARVLNEGDDPAPGKTQQGQMVGTLPYMSPEQVGGDSQDVDTRSDVYALGVVLYELLSGRLPYDVSTCPLYEAMRVIRERPAAALEDLPRRMRADINAVLGRALAKDRAGRYQSAGALAADLRRILSDEPVAARPATVTAALVKLARKHKPAALAAGVGLLALVAGLVISTFLLGKSEAQLRAMLSAQHEGDPVNPNRVAVEVLSREVREHAAAGRAEQARAAWSAAAAIARHELSGDPGVMERLRRLGEEVGVGEQ
jgi:serine/threonine protein kinase